MLLSSGSITISTSVGYLKQIEFTTDGTNYFSDAPEDWEYSNKVFTTSSKTQTSITLDNGNGTTKIEQIDVLIGQAYSVTYNSNGGSGTMTDYLYRPHADSLQMRPYYALH